MSGNVTELNDSGFDNAVQSGVTLIDFWAPWCGPCQQQAPILESVADSIGGKATIAKINVDENNATAGRFGVQSIPTLVLLKDGEEINRFVGLQSEAALIEAIEAAT